MVAERVPWTSVRKIGARLTTPLHPDDYLTLINPLWTARELRGRVEKVIPETDDAATIVIRPGWGWRYDHKPGPVRRDRDPGQGQVPLALLLGVLAAQARRPDDRDHGAGDARGVPVHPPRRGARARHDHPAGGAQR